MKNIKRFAAYFLICVMLSANAVPTYAENGEDAPSIVQVYNATFDAFSDGTAAYDKFDDGLKIMNWENSVASYADAAYFVKNPAEDAKDGDIVVRGLCRKNTWFSVVFNADKKEVKEELQNAQKMYLTADVYFDDNFDKKVDLSWWTQPFNELKGIIGNFSFDFPKNEIRAGGVSVYSGEIRNKWHTVGILADNETKEVSYFFDNKPIAGAQKIKEAWNGTLNGMGRFLYARLNGMAADCNVYFNNVAAYSLPNIEFESDLGKSAELPEEITLKRGEESENVKVLWDTSGIDTNKEGEYDVVGTVLEAPVKISAKLTIADFLKKEMETLSEKIDAKSATQEECLTFYNKLAGRIDYANRAEYMARINEYINGFSNDTISQEPDLSSKIDAAKRDIVLNFDRLLETSAEIELCGSTGEKIPVTVEYGEKSIRIKLVDGLKINEDYTVTINGLADKFGNTLGILPIKFTTKIISANIRDGEKYGYGKELLWKENGKNIITAKIIKEGGSEENAENGFVFTETGNYEIILSADDGSEVEKFNITILEAVAPVASNVKITGRAETGETISASYDFFDENNDEEKNSLYQWYRNGEKIPDATGLSYTLTEDDEDKMIAFEVTPRADSLYENTGKSVRAEFLGACRPVAENVKINGKIKFSEELSATYELHDKNGDEEIEGAECKWILENEKGEKKTVGEGEKYTVAEDDKDGILWFEITPKSKVRPYNGETVKIKMIMPARPKAEEIKVSGNARVGNVLTGTYKWTDANSADGDKEGLTEEHWVNASTGEIVAEGAAIELDSKLKGETIYYEVIPKSTDEPCIGDAARSESFKITGTSSSSSGGGGSSGGGQSIYIPPKPTDNKDSEPQIKFKDTENHWAKTYIEELYEKGIVKGIDSEHFAPDKEISRAEFIALIMRISGVGESEYYGDFADVSDDFWGAGYIASALENGFIAKAEYFRPNDSIKREEAAKLIALIASDMPILSEDISFSDSGEISDWAADYIRDCAQRGLIKGDEHSRVNPKSRMTRAEAVTVIWRMMQNEDTK